MRAAWLALALSASCGKKGSHAAPVEAPPPVVTGVVDTSIKTVSGTVYLGDSSHPAGGYELWTLDHTAGTVRRDTLPASGAFSFAVDDYVQDDVYTVHVLKDFQLLADLDMSVAAAGVQAAFSYTGGPGFEMGSVILAVDAHGDPDPAVASVAARLGGGFSALPSSTAAFASFPTPKALSRLALGSQLYVFEPATLLHSFYRRAANPALYAQDLPAFSRIGVRADAAPADTLRRVLIEDAGSWLKAARLAATDDDPPHGVGGLWSATNYKAETTDKLAFSASAFAEAVLPRRTVVLLKAQIGEVDPEAHVPRLVGPVVTVPPLLRSVDLGTGTLAAIDYAQDGPNGLTHAFCRTGNVQLGLDSPLDETGAVVAGLDTVEVGLDFYATNDKGAISGVEVLPTDLPPAWQAVVDDTIGASARHWQPETRTFTITLGGSDLTASPHVVALPSELFVAQVAAGDVSYIRLRVYFKSSKGAAEGAIAVWFDNVCS